TRTARGVLAAKSLSQVVGFIEENSAKYPNIVEPVFAHFEMCSGPDDIEPPLGWAMSDASREFLESLLSEGVGNCNNAAQLAVVLKALKGG
ncbi:MAG: hypothetical protein GY947_18275, partial [Rhodobacteraceae bacterium]|nr:hypothetical protein [Paracoccaceae bacterium]